MALYSDSSKQFLQELLRLTKYDLIATGTESLSVAGTAVGLASVPSDAKYAIMIVESSVTATPAIRYLELGGKTLPTSSVGIPRSNLDAFDVFGYQNLINFRAIQYAAGTHTITVQYYK